MASYLFITFAVTAILGFPIWVVLMASSYVALEFGSTLPTLVMVQRMFTATDSFPTLAVPLFMVAGNLMETGGISRRLINFCNAVLGWLPGGLGMAGILTCMFFAAISGSGPATVAAIGGIMIPEMERAGYDKAFAAAIMAVAGAIGVIIPPSIPMVNFGVVGTVSIASLFAAGFGPGILVGVALMLVVFFTSKKNGYGEAIKVKFSIKNIIKEGLKAFWALLMPVIILGGIYGGIFTPTEAAAVAVVYGFFVGVVIHRELKLKHILPIFMNAGKSTAMVTMIIASASGFGWILTSARIPDAVANAMLAVSSSKIIILLLINILLLIVGCLMETTAAIIILTPIFLPIVTQLGVNPIHFGIIMVVNLAIGMSTPPLGVNLFVACGIAKITIEQIVKAIIWLLIANITALLLITYVPAISMAIPQLMGIA